MKYVFVGNRRFVLEEMLTKGLDTQVLVVEGTHLHREPLLLSIPHTIIHTKEQLINHLESTDFDVLVSNGLPHILPISKMQPAIYINIHPSYLPDLKGIDPTHGSILFERDGGAACHLMTDDVDAGDIISRIKIPYTPDLDVSLLYQLSFIAEKQVFNESLERNFAPLCAQEKLEDLIYYSRRDEDKFISFNETNREIIAKIKAFNNKSQGCTFYCQGEKYKTYAVDIITNPYMMQYAEPFDNKAILLVYEDCIVVKKDGDIIKLSNVQGNLNRIELNTIIG